MLHAGGGDPGEIEKIIHSLDFENQEYVKQIEKEKQQIDALEKQVHDCQEGITRLQENSSQLDEDTKRYHKQFTQNRDNIDSMKMTLNVLSEHEHALSQKLEMSKMKAQMDRKEQDEVLQHYAAIWEEYREKYSSFPLAQRLEQEKSNMQQAQQHLDVVQQQVNMLHHQLEEVKKDKGKTFLPFTSLNKFIVKLAQLKLDTKKYEDSISTYTSKHKEVTQKIKDVQEDKAQKKKEAAEALHQQQLEEARLLEVRHQEEARKEAEVQRQAAIQQQLEEARIRQDADNRQAELRARMQAEELAREMAAENEGSLKSPAISQSQEPPAGLKPAHQQSTTKPQGSQMQLHFPQLLTSSGYLSISKPQSPATSQFQTRPYQRKSPPKLQIPTRSQPRLYPYQNHQVSYQGQNTVSRSTPNVSSQDQQHVPQISASFSTPSQQSYSAHVSATASASLPASSQMAVVAPQIASQASTPLVSINHVTSPRTPIPTTPTSSVPTTPSVLQATSNPEKSPGPTATKRPSPPSVLDAYQTSASNSSANTPNRPGAARSLEETPEQSPSCTPTRNSYQASPFELEKHLARISMLTKSPGFQYSSRPMFMSDGQTQAQKEPEQTKREDVPAQQAESPFMRSFFTDQLETTNQSKSGGLFSSSFGGAGDAPASMFSSMFGEEEKGGSPAHTSEFSFSGGGMANQSTPAINMFSDFGKEDSSSSTQASGGFAFSFGGGSDSSPKISAKSPFSLF